MCTVTAIWRQGGYELFFNRDEKRSRGKALPPSPQARDAVTYIAPTDADFGGTWIAANRFGITLCLLNGPNPNHKQGTRSRGLLIPDFIAVESIEAVASGIGAMNLHPFAPFVLLVVEPAERAREFRWDGEELVSQDTTNSGLFLTTSSYDSGAVVASRMKRYEIFLRKASELDPTMVEAMHKSHDPARGPYSICMHRDDAETVSFTHIRVTPDEISCSYLSHAPCVESQPMMTRLDRKIG